MKTIYSAMKVVSLLVAIIQTYVLVYVSTCGGFFAQFCEMMPVDLLANASSVVLDTTITLTLVIFAVVPFMATLAEKRTWTGIVIATPLALANLSMAVGWWAMEYNHAMPLMMAVVIFGFITIINDCVAGAFFFADYKETVKPS